MSENKTPESLTTDLASIGLILKQKREEHSYTLEHVAEITRITLTNLRNIENGELEALPGLVFVRGFIRNYAKLVGVESDWMIEALNQTFTNREQPVDGSSTVEKQDQPLGKERNNSKFLLIGATVVIILVIAGIYWNISTSNRYSSMTERVETVQAVEKKEVAAEEVLKEVEMNTGPKTSEENQAKTVPVISPLSLTLVALESQWIRLVVDEQEPIELELVEGEKYEWPANKEYLLTMTTGSTASIHLNGEEIVDRENFTDELFQTKLNKFTLTRINNR
jgi:cytoskeletal protein RodZ